MRRFKEGAGAGFEVTIKGLPLKNDIKLEKNVFDGGRYGQYKYWTCSIQKSKVDFWEAEGYDWQVSSDGIYYDGELMQEYSSEDYKVDGGYIRGIVWLDEVSEYTSIPEDELTDNDIIDFIKDSLDSEVDLKSIVGGGYTYSSLGKEITMGYEKFDENTFFDIVDEDDGFYLSDGINIGYIDMIAPYIAEDIDWYHDNYYNFDEIFFGDDEDF